MVRSLTMDLFRARRFLCLTFAKIRMISRLIQWRILNLPLRTPDNWEILNTMIEDRSGMQLTYLMWKKQKRVLLSKVLKNLRVSQKERPIHWFPIMKCQAKMSHHPSTSSEIPMAWKAAQWPQLNGSKWSSDHRLLPIVQLHNFQLLKSKIHNKRRPAMLWKSISP